MKYQTSAEQINALLRCDEHIQFIQEVLDKIAIPAPLKQEFQQRIERIEQRQQDPNLYLAVVGEFSSGKSTFINALLKEEVLKASALVATATATKIKYGSKLQVNAKFSDERSDLHKTVSASLNDLPWLPQAARQNFSSLVHTLTSDETVTSHLSNLEISHPAPFLSNGVVVIDTPGTNADNKSHGAITRKVVEQEADLAIIIIPATIPLSQSLANFLSSSLAPYIHRCIFVVTRIDEIKPEEQNALIQDLRARLVDKLGITPPQLYLCSAQIMLDVLSGETITPEYLKVFYDRFLALEQIIIKRLIAERNTSISESLLRLLTQLFDQLDIPVREQWEAFEAQQNKIKQETIPDLSEFSQAQYDICKRQLASFIADYKAKVIVKVESHQLATLEKVKKQVFNASSEDTLNNIIKTQSEQLIVTEQAQLQNELKIAAQALETRAVIVGQAFDQRFGEVYQRLQAIGGQVEAVESAQFDFNLNPSAIAVSAQTLTKEIDSDDGRNMGLGAAAGFAIGTVLLPIPVVGSAVGLAAGTWASRFFSPSLADRKQQVWDKLSPEINQYYDKVKIETQKASSDYAASLEIALKQRIDRYIQQYENTVKGIAQQQESTLKSLQARQYSTQQYLSEIERRQKRLNEQKRTLAEIS